MDQPGILKTACIAAVAAALTLGLAACGDDTSTSTGATPDPGAQQVDFTDERDGLVKPEPALDSVNRQPRGASVDYNSPPPPISANVEAAAKTAGCTATAWPSEANPSSHVGTESETRISNPPLSGAHNERWADWGVYNKPVPFKHQLHNLEHGGVFVHYGKDVPVAGVNAIREWWAKSPAFILVAPNTAPTFPTDAVVVGSWQRWLVCKPFAPAQISAVDAFVKEYRGRGPEQILAVNAGGDLPEGLPKPAISDKGAEG